MSATLRQLREDIADHCVAVEDMFKVPTKVTIIARDPQNPNMEVVVSNDDLEQVISALNRASTRPPV